MGSKFAYSYGHVGPLFLGVNVKKLKFTRLSFLRKGIFAKKSTRLLLDVVGSFCGFILVVFLLVLGRLSMGPINLDFLTPDVEAAFQAPQAGIRATIDH